MQPRLVKAPWLMLGNAEQNWILGDQRWGSDVRCWSVMMEFFAYLLESHSCIGFIMGCIGSPFLSARFHTWPDWYFGLDYFLANLG